MSTAAALRYNIPFIVMNNRQVSVHDVQENHAAANTAFEQATFDFIRAWLAGDEQFIINTSGSTGAAKSIFIARDQMRRSAMLTVNSLGLIPGDVAFVCLNTQYIAGRMMLVRALEAGMRIIAAEPSATPLAGITDHIDFVAMVPLQIEATLASDGAEKFDDMKAIIIGGAAVSDALQNSIQKINAPVYATYGMTETVSHIALKRLNGEDASSYFVALNGVDLERDDRGCLVIRASHLPDAIVTNDLVEISDGNKFQWLGRWDNVINSGGIKVMPEKLEAEIGKIFNRFDIRQNYFVHGMRDERLGFKIILVVEGEFFVKKNEVFEAIYQTFSKYEAPKELLLVPKFIYTPTGKINRMKTLNLS